MLGLCEQCIGDSLNSRQKSIIDRCVRKMYIDIARSREKYIPVMSDFYDILMAQPEEEAKEIALSLELFVNGSLNIFNHQTNVDVDNRFVVYGIRDLGTELSPITMLVMMESIQQRIVENGKRGKATWLYIDEFHVLLNSEYSAKYLQQLWKKVRKQGGLCTGITQNVVDLLQNYTATTMLANSEFVALLKQANTDSSKMAEVIGVSDAQLRFVTNSQSGMGLLKCGNVVIPFDNQISKDTSLYKLYNTNLHEKVEMENIGKKSQRKWTVKRGEVYFADLGENIGSEENKIRPVVVLQSNAYNFHSPVFTVAIISSSTLTIPDIQIPITGKYPFVDENGTTKNLCGAIDLGQIKTIGKERIVSKKVCDLSVEMKEVDIKLLNVLGLSSIIKKKDNLIQSLTGKVDYLKEQLKKKDEE